MKGLSVPKSLVDRGDLDFGLSKGALEKMANVISFAQQNSKSDSNRTVEDSTKVSNLMQTLACAIVKDTIPGEEGATINTTSFLLQAQKINLANTNGLAKSNPSAAINLNSSISAPGLEGKDTTLIFGQADSSLYPSNSSDSMKTKIVRFSLFDTGSSELSVKNMSEPIEITFKIPPGNASNPTCKYWDPIKKEWSSEGLTLISSTNESITCATTHLSDFSILDSTILPQIVEPNIGQIFWMVYIMSGLFIFLFLWSCFYERLNLNDKQKIFPADQSNTTARAEHATSRSTSPEDRYNFCTIICVRSH